jgi:hypothetical protein
VICPEGRPQPPCRHTDLLTATEWQILGALDTGDADLTDLIALMRASADDCFRCAAPILHRLAADPEHAATAFQAYTYIASAYWGPNYHLGFGRSSALACACLAVEARLDVRVADGATITDMVTTTLRGDLIAVLAERTAAQRKEILDEVLAVVRVGRRHGQAHRGGGGHQRPEGLR